jgi:hypothetical protein
MSRPPRARDTAPVVEADSRPSYPLSDAEVAAKEVELMASLQDHEARKAELDAAESEAAQLKEAIAETDLGQQLAAKKEEIKDTREILASVAETIRRLAWETTHKATREEQASLPLDTKPAKAPKATAKERTAALGLEGLTSFSASPPVALDDGDEAPAHDPALVRETLVGGVLIEVIVQMDHGVSYEALDIRSDVNDMLTARGEVPVTSEEMTRALRAALDSGRLVKGPGSRGKANYVRPAKGKGGKAPATTTASFTGEMLDTLKSVAKGIKGKHGVTGVSITSGGKTVAL